MCSTERSLKDSTSFPFQSRNSKKAIVSLSFALRKVNITSFIMKTMLMRCVYSESLDSLGKRITSGWLLLLTLIIYISVRLSFGYFAIWSSLGRNCANLTSIGPEVSLWPSLSVLSFAHTQKKNLLAETEAFFLSRKGKLSVKGNPVNHLGNPLLGVWATDKNKNICKSNVNNKQKNYFRD